MKRGIYLALLIAIALASFFPVSAFASHQEPPAAGPQPLFAPAGPDGAPGAWIWVSSESRWQWVAAEARVGAQTFATPSSVAPAWPSDVTKFWVEPAATPGAYWVWDVFSFADGDEGPSIWTPRWRLVTGTAPLGL